ncbi:DUF6000 family protein [Streptomyces sp. NPDC005408]|uniref:DUF6000 family protein n=1 Tax=Streptomyces sp. NPDC005408 TaxID=3155341 RepID=UPI0033BB2658
MIGIDHREAFREHIGELLRRRLLLRPGPLRHAPERAGRGRARRRYADAEILTAYLDRYLPRTDLHYDQPDALGALLHLDGRLGTHNADRFTRPAGLWDQWLEGMGRLSPTAGHARRSRYSRRASRHPGTGTTAKAPGALSVLG